VRYQDVGVWVLLCVFHVCESTPVRLLLLSGSLVSGVHQNGRRAASWAVRRVEPGLCVCVHGASVHTLAVHRRTTTRGLTLPYRPQQSRHEVASTITSS